MSFKWLINQHFIWNVITRDGRKFHNFCNGLFKTMDVLQYKDSIVELVEREFEKPGTKQDIHSCKKETFRGLVSKLFHYSKSTQSSLKIDRFVSSLSTPSSMNKVLYKDLLEFFIEKSDLDGIVMVEKLYSYDKDLGSLESIACAQSAWRNGKISSSFDLFSTLYDRADLKLRKEILRILQGLIFYSLAKKGKAVVRDVIQCATAFSRDKNELSLLVCVWYSLFTSDMYEDRCEADILLRGNSCLQKSLEKYIPWIGYLFLRNDEVTYYQRLIETALHYNMDNSVGLLLRNLFNYYYHSGYISGCSAVYKCCQDLNVRLTHDQLYKYHTLKSSGSTKRIKKLEISLPEDVKFKF